MADEKPYERPEMNGVIFSKILWVTIPAILLALSWSWALGLNTLYCIIIAIIPAVLLGIFLEVKSSKILDKETRVYIIQASAQVVSAPLLLLAVIGGVVGLIIKFVA